MTPQETELLSNFLGQLAQVKGIPKDPEADALIAKTVASQPDAAYLLVQRSLIQDQAIESATARIAALEAEAQRLRSASPAQPAAASSFLGGAGWGRSATTPMSAAVPMNAAGTGPVAQPGMTAARQMAAPAAQAGRAGPGFLGMAAATAAGVVGGAFLFQGVQSLMNAHHQPEQLGGGNDLSSAAASGTPADTGLIPFDNSSANDDASFDTAMDDNGADSDYA